MADKKNSDNKDPKPLSAPVILFPQEENVVDCQNPRFIWEPVDGATAYFVEIAADPGFEQVVFQEDVGTATNIGIDQEFPDDERTYYWRVYAGNEDGWSHGENVESFICGKPESISEQYGSPDIDEEYGPAAELFKGAAVEVAADLSDDEGIHRLEEEMGVAHEGIEAKQIMGLVIAVIVALILIIVIIITYAGRVAQTTRQAVQARSAYPELEDTRSQGRAQLDRYEIIDQEEGRYRIPLDRAMELMVAEDTLTTREYSQELEYLRED